MSQLRELLPISNNKIGEEEVNAISARDLHKFLGSKQDFSTWIRKRINDYEFVEHVDYVKVQENLAPQFCGTENANSLSKLQGKIEYYISLDMAKELAMVDKSQQGRAARKYFIECEKQLKQVLTTENQLILNTVLANTVEERMLAMSEYRAVIVQPLLEFKEEATPKVNYHDKVLNSPDLMNISEIAKDYKLSAVKLNKILREEGVQYKDKKGEWTQSGRLFIYELLKTKGILPRQRLGASPKDEAPICEQEDSNAQ